MDAGADNKMKKMYLDYAENLKASLDNIDWTSLANLSSEIRKVWREGKHVFICGNGGSSSDSDHIVGELMKSFFYDRALSDEDKLKLVETSPEIGRYLSENLQPALRSISLSAHNALNTAIANEKCPNIKLLDKVWQEWCGVEGWGTDANGRWMQMKGKK